MPKAIRVLQTILEEQEQNKLNIFDFAVQAQEANLT